MVDLDPQAIGRQLDDLGYAIAPALLSVEQCREIAAMYAEPARFRSRIVMQRHSFGQGEYKYFAYPLPEDVERLRHAAYRALAPIAPIAGGRRSASPAGSLTTSRLIWQNAMRPGSTARRRCC